MNNELCSFCGGSVEDETKMLVGANGNICATCVESCNDILGINTTGYGKEIKELKTLSPKQIVSELDKHIIGQEDAKKDISIAVYNHYKRIGKKTSVKIDKSNILLLGPTGCGKTLIAKTLAKILDVPFCIADATTLTEAGYVGEDVESILQKLYINSGNDIEKTERGIVYIDEIDKIAVKGENKSITRDVSGEGVQQALLKIIEGTVSNVMPSGARRNPNADTIPINTENILFICGGAFPGLDKMIEKRTETRSLGFGSTVKTKEEKSKENLLKKVENSDLTKYGIIPELQGRLPITTVIDPLDEEALASILTDPENSIVEQYQELCKLEEGFLLKFNKKALRKVANIALNKGIGARGLKSIMEKTLKDLMYELPDYAKEINTLTITEKMVEDPSKIINRLSKTIKKVA